MKSKIIAALHSLTEKASPNLEYKLQDFAEELETTEFDLLNCELNGKTAIDAAIESYDFDVVNFVIEKGALVDAAALREKYNFISDPLAEILKKAETINYRREALARMAVAGDQEKMRITLDLTKRNLAEFDRLLFGHVASGETIANFIATNGSDETRELFEQELEERMLISGKLGLKDRDLYMAIKDDNLAEAVQLVIEKEQKFQSPIFRPFLEKRFLIMASVAAEMGKPEMLQLFLNHTGLIDEEKWPDLLNSAVVSGDVETLKICLHEKMIRNLRQDPTAIARQNHFQERLKNSEFSHAKEMRADRKLSTMLLAETLEENAAPEISQKNREDEFQQIINSTFSFEGTQSTLLHVAVANGRADIAKFLLDCGANCDAINENKETPLHCAVKSLEFNDPEIVAEMISLLLKNGANPFTKDCDQETPLQVLLNSECPEDIVRKSIELLSNAERNSASGSLEKGGVAQKFVAKNNSKSPT